MEVKNRANRLFDSVPDYEYVQVQGYMQALSSATSVSIVQQFRNAQGEITNGTAQVDRDEAFWSKHVCPRLSWIATCAQRFVNDAELREAWWSSSSDVERAKVMLNAVPADLADVRIHRIRFL